MTDDDRHYLEVLLQRGLLKGPLLSSAPGFPSTARAAPFREPGLRTWARM